MNDLENIPISFSTVSDNNLISLLLYGNERFSDTKNKKMLMSAIRFIKKLKENIYSKTFSNIFQKKAFSYISQSGTF